MKTFKDLLKEDGILDKISPKYGDFRIKNKFAADPQKDFHEQIYRDLRTFVNDYFGAQYNYALDLAVRKLAGEIEKEIQPQKGQGV